MLLYKCFHVCITILLIDFYSKYNRTYKENGLNVIFLHNKIYLHYIMSVLQRGRMIYIRRYIISGGLLLIGFAIFFYLEVLPNQSTETEEKETINMAGSDSEERKNDINISDEQKERIEENRKRHEHETEVSEVYEGGELSTSTLNQYTAGDTHDYSNAEYEETSDKNEQDNPVITIPLGERVKHMSNINSLWMALKNVSVSDTITYQGEELEADQDLLEADTEIDGELEFLTLTFDIENDTETEFLMINFPQRISELPIKAVGSGERIQHPKVSTNMYVTNEAYEEVIPSGDSGELTVAFLTEKGLNEEADLYLLNNSLAMSETIMFTLE